MKSTPLPLGQISFMFMQFSAKCLQNNEFKHPSLGSPGSATDLCESLDTFLFSIKIL